jgi:hypothetical protein
MRPITPKMYLRQNGTRSFHHPQTYINYSHAAAQHLDLLRLLHAQPMMAAAQPNQFITESLGSRLTVV